MVLLGVGGWRRRGRGRRGGVGGGVGDDVGERPGRGGPGRPTATSTVTTPSCGATTGCSIFMASIVTMRSPACDDASPSRDVDRDHGRRASATRSSGRCGRARRGRVRRASARRWPRGGSSGRSRVRLAVGVHPQRAVGVDRGVDGGGARARRGVRLATPSRPGSRVDARVTSPSSRPSTAERRFGGRRRCATPAVVRHSQRPRRRSADAASRSGEPQRDARVTVAGCRARARGGRRRAGVGASRRRAAAGR